MKRTVLMALLLMLYCGGAIAARFPIPYPTIDAPVEFDRLLKLDGEFDQVLVAYEDETGVGLDKALKQDARSVLIVVGPEGGFEPAEIEALKSVGAASFSLGPRRLRAETAAVTVAAMTLGLLGDLG